MIEFIPSVNAARVGKVCISRKHNTKKPMNAERQIELIEGRKKTLLNFDGSIRLFIVLLYHTKSVGI